MVSDMHRWDEVFCHLSAHKFQLLLNVTSFDDDDIASIDARATETAKPTTTGTHVFDVESIRDPELTRRRVDGHPRCLSFSVPSKTESGGGSDRTRWTVCLEDAQGAATLFESVKALQTALDAVEFG